MVLGIPEYRLARGAHRREIDAILELGIEVRTGCRVGVDVTLDELLDRHEALFVGVGTGRGRILDLPGHELDGVLRAVEFLLNVNHGFRVELGERVVVVGGGNVAFDAARTALRARRDDPAPTVADQSGTTRGHDDHARRRRLLASGVATSPSSRSSRPRRCRLTPEEIAEAERGGHPHRVPPRSAPHRRRRACDRARDDRRSERVRRERPLRPDLRAGHRGDPPGRHRDPGGRPGRRRVLLGDDLRSSGRVRVVSGSTTSCARRTRGSGPAVTSPSGPATSSTPSPTVAVPPRRSTPRSSAGRRPGDERSRLDRSRPAPASVACRPATTPSRACPCRRCRSSAASGSPRSRSGYDETDAVLEGLRCLRCFDNIMLDPSCASSAACASTCARRLHHDRARRPRRRRHRVAVGVAPRRGAVHPLRPVREPLPPGCAGHGARWRTPSGTTARG